MVLGIVLKVENRSSLFFFESRKGNTIYEMGLICHAIEAGFGLLVHRIKTGS
jgi:hypothetical protein